MAKLKEVVFEVGGLVKLPDYENVRVYYGERLLLEEGDDPAEVKRKLVARVKKKVEAEIAEAKADARKAARRSADRG